MVKHGLFLRKGTIQRKRKVKDDMWRELGASWTGQKTSLFGVQKKKVIKKGATICLYSKGRNKEDLGYLYFLAVRGIKHLGIPGKCLHNMESVHPTPQW